MARTQNPQIREFILENVEALPKTIATATALKFSISRAGVGRYMARLVNEGLLTATGETRAREYRLKPLVYKSVRLERSAYWTENDIWREHILPLMKGVRQNVVDICQYGFTEMFNNVIDHSNSPDAIIVYEQTYGNISIRVIDHGVGIFDKIKSDFKLADARTALLELSKGKLTSDRKNHSGEGIYFTSRMFEKFSILSGLLYYSRVKKDGDDWLLETQDRDDPFKGTGVRMEIPPNADWTTKEVFERYQGENVYFRKTHVPLVLGQYPGEQLVSRSQAKRILTRFADFSEVILDFIGVAEIGQPFADEIFRVFKNEHPDIPLIAINTSEGVKKMISYVQAAGESTIGPSSPPDATIS